MSGTFELTEIATVRSTRHEPRDDGWDAETSWLELAPSFPEDAMAGLDAFSHAEVVFVFHGVKPDKIETAARHPRGNAAWPKVGIFAQRGKNRPNRLGATICRIERLDGRRLYVKGLDAIDGTPVVDLKPWMREFGPRGPVSQPEWATELMRTYW
jgi:tRNA-Thr(GGU) m(6)t(6)A37 methyltransferase TsaA